MYAVYATHIGRRSVNSKVYRIGSRKNALAMARDWSARKVLDLALHKSATATVEVIATSRDTKVPAAFKPGRLIAAFRNGTRLSK